MCKTRNIAYTCKHTRQFRLSTCRGTVTVQSKPTRPPKAACESTPLLTFKAEGDCGACERLIREKELENLLNDRRASLRWGDPDFAAAEEDYGRDLYQMHRRFPEQKFKNHRRPEVKQPASLLRRSILKHEVQPEDVVVKYEGNGWDYDWGEGYPSLADEIAEREAENDAWFGEDISGTEECLDDQWTSDTALEGPIETGATDEDLVSTPSETITEKRPLLEQTNLQPQPTVIFKALPPHARRCSSMTQSKCSSNSDAKEVELLERFRCFQLQYLVTVSS